ncbi:outer membrane beta-barrel protein [Aurantiacibacter aquimixticola]|uniref:Outer membrane protein beta-barrel domain-containing protein n=1 Tax=Aurantiacibacter aquimixticola TaxID=1958945 RepID=A0A419RV52_9SPHN|nr:outer membrane beta-barrel protein [Aurantiacibacter aquimixticola]RJY09666.1 hypothetical protein D6201_10140 [Aurantiacibacter aquimixticola]
MKNLLIAAALGAVVATPAYAQDLNPAAEDKAGARIEGRVFWERINDPEEDIGINYELGSGVGFGGEIGYDIPVSETVLVGPYAQYSASTVETCELHLCVSSGGYWAAGLQVGFITGQSGMVYGKLGYGQQTVDLVGPFEFEGETFNFDESESGGGYKFALGYDHSFSENIYGRIDLSVSESYDIYDFDFQRTTIGIGIGARF